MDFAPLNIITPFLPCMTGMQMPLAEDSLHYDRIKHVDIVYHYLREEINNKQIHLEYILTDNMPADDLPESLGSVKVHRHTRHGVTRLAQQSLNQRKIHYHWFVASKLSMTKMLRSSKYRASVSRFKTCPLYLQLSTNSFMIFNSNVTLKLFLILDPSQAVVRRWKMHSHALLEIKLLAFVSLILCLFVCFVVCLFLSLSALL